MDILKYNEEAWDALATKGNRWTLPVSSQEIDEARKGRWELVLTPNKPVPRKWFGEVAGKDILCLASGGGQQGPVLAAAGARVTVYDQSNEQLNRDRQVAERDHLTLATVQGDMRDLSAFAPESFDLIVHPCSNVFVENPRPVWLEAFRVLRPGGALLSGISNPILYCFDQTHYDAGELVARFKIPYADSIDLSPEELQAHIESGEPLAFAHTLEDQIGGQLDAGFLLAGFYEDSWGGNQLIDRYFDAFMATRAIKPR